MRNEKAERMTRLIQYTEENDRNAIAAEIGEMPSPHGVYWAAYIQHRLHVMQCGIEQYATRSYARLRLDKHIQSHRAMDKLTGFLCNHKPAIVMLGAGAQIPNSPIKIRKHVRCPFNRKLIGSFKKRSCLVRMVDEYNSSQHCGVCVKRFPRRTKPFRYKKCENCVPQDLLLPPVIVTNKSKRQLQMDRTIMREWQRMRDEEADEIAAMLTEPITGSLVPKKQRFSKTWTPNANVIGDDNDTAQPQPINHTTVWHRDISAARLILIRGT